MPWKSSSYYIFWVCVYSLSSPACEAHAPYFHLWPFLFNHISPHLINGTIFVKKKHVFWFWFSIQLLSEIDIILRRIERDVIINIHSSSYEVPLFLSDFDEIWIFSADIRKKSSNIKFLEDPFSGSRVVPCGRTDRQTCKAHSSFSQFCERA